MSIRPITARQAYIDQVASGKEDFDKTSAFFLKCIKENPQNVGSKREILAIAIKGYRSYLQNTLCGRIESFFYGILKCFGIQSNLDRAETKLHTISPKRGFEEQAAFEDKTEKALATYLACKQGKTLYFLRNDQSILVANPNSDVTECSSEDSEYLLYYVRMVRDLAIEQKKPLVIPLGDNPASGPSTILMANPNGDVYELSRNRKACKGHGASRSFYEGILHSRDENTRKIGILTTMPRNLPSQRDFNYDDVLGEVTEASYKMENEYRLLKNLQGNKHVIQVHDHFSSTIGGFKVGFVIMDHHERGNLNTYMDTTEYQNLTPQKKLIFMMCLRSILLYIHDLGLIHRDLKPENIVVDKNGLPVGIDFESCIKLDNEALKKETVSTIAYWPPEYADAYLTGIRAAQDAGKDLDEAYPFVTEHISAATTQAMDAWALGLIFFQVFFGEQLISKLLGYSKMDNRMPLQQAQNLQMVLKNTLPEFIRQMEIIGEPTNKKWIKIKKAIDSNKMIWKDIILPLLEADPTKRRTIAKI